MARFFVSSVREIAAALSRFVIGNKNIAGKFVCCFV